MKQKGREWIDENGKKVETKWIDGFLKFDEKAAQKLYAKAKKIEADLIEFKEMSNKMFDESLDRRAKEFKTDIQRRSHSIMSFDKSIKIKRHGQTAHQYDESLLLEAKSLFEKYIQKNIPDKNNAVRHMILDAFNKSGGKFDPKRFAVLAKYRSKVKDADFQKAFELLDKATDLVLTKSYIQIYEKNEEGKYESILLNLSNAGE